VLEPLHKPRSPAQMSRKPHNQASQLTILLLDDQQLFRAGLAHLLDELAVEVTCLHAGSFTEAEPILSSNSAIDLVLVDLETQGFEGFTGLRRLVKSDPERPVVVVSRVERVATVRGAIREGARGYIPKSSSPQVMYSALQLILAGGVYLPPNLLEGASAGGAAEPLDSLRDFDAAGGRLTRRQRDVLRLLSEGRSNKEIAAALGLSAGTVKIHVSSIFKSLGVNNRTQAVIVAAKMMQDEADGPV